MTSVLLLFLSLASADASATNVVMIIGDDMGWNDFSFMGSQEVHTPNIDRLAAQSALFPNGYVPSSLCRASLATLLTGQYAHQHKICCNDPPDGVDRAAMHPFIKSAPALPRLLGEHGYVSLQTGKFWEGHFSNAGFTSGMTTKGRHGEDGLAIGRQTMKPIEEFLDGRGKRPFFIWYAPMLPHQPHNPPERLLAKYRTGRDIHLARYYAMCEWFDETVGEMLSILDKRNLRGETLVVFAIDNGWIQETGAPENKQAGFDSRSKRSPYDAGLRTPILLSQPGRIPPAQFKELISTIDLAPTILGACDVAIPPSLPGVNLLPLVTDGVTLQRDAVFGEIFLHTCEEIDRPAVNLTHRWVRQGPWKLIVPAGPDAKVELFNIELDPHETRDRAADEPEVVEKLHARLDGWWGGKDS